ncbi:MAG: hypothetical protein KJ069_29180 [Anaerolineae bacterium]|nr:hypothetical protein [Anaerolineae bacterium]
MAEKITQSQILSALLPSIAFVGFLLFVVSPGLPSTLRYFVLDATTLPILFLVLSLTTAFVLSGLNIFFMKILEGYIILERFPFFQKYQQLRAVKINQKRMELEAELSEIYHTRREPELDKVNALQNRLYEMVAYYELNFPSDIDDAVPTMFGNILRAAEEYSVRRYGIDAVTVWPRLVHVIPDAYLRRIEQGNNRLSFMVYCVFLSLLSAMILFFISAVYVQMSWLLFGSLFFMLALFFYTASLPTARVYGTLIRGAFDLFRFDLLRQLNFEIPQDSDEEYDLWRKISESIAVGNALGPLSFSYRSNDGQKSFDEFVETDFYAKEDNFGSTTIMPAQLRQILITCFSESELQDLCFDLNIDFESLPGLGKNDKVRELIRYFQRHGQYSELVEVCRNMRPFAPWT